MAFRAPYFCTKCFVIRNNSAITLSDIVFYRVCLMCPLSVQMEHVMVVGRFQRYLNGDTFL